MIRISDRFLIFMNKPEHMNFLRHIFRNVSGTFPEIQKIEKQERENT